MKNQDGTIEIHDRTEFIDKISIEPEDISPEHPHEIIISLKGLQKLLPPQAELIVSYPILAKNPKPEEKYPMPIETAVNASIKGLEFKKIYSRRKCD